MLHHILLVEDDLARASRLSGVLIARFKVERARSAEEVRRRLSTARIDALILDWALPDGCALIKRLRRSERHCNLLILAVTGQADRERCLEALRAGADEVVAQPIDPDILLARLDSLFRRRDRPWIDSLPFFFDGLRYEPASRTVVLKGKQLALRPKELELLEFFIENPSRVLAPEALWAAVWGPQRRRWEHTLDVTLSSLRQALGTWSKHLETHKGLGYMLAVVPSRGA